jgi:NarL family two-component system sensor histidine kinase LiaS
VFATDQGEGPLLGAVVYVAEPLPTGRMIPPHTFGLLLPSLLIFLLAAGVVGAIVGSLTARSMVRRFEHLSAVSDAWSEGDFTEFIDDSKGDEIALLGQRLDRMAEQLKDLLKRSQEMAVSAERNRLARDLHDSAKQQALAASFQIGTALTLFESEPHTAKSHLQEADHLVDSVRKELTDLIHELRPQAADDRDIAEIINEHAIEWAHQNGIEVHLELQDPADLSMGVKEALYRILQEALANVARHSSASHVKITLCVEDEWLYLAVEDDGQGFDPQAEHSGMGLESMRERAETIHGNFRMKSAPGQGTRVTVTSPLENNDGELNG